MADGSTQRLMQLARDGDTQAWLDLARINARRGVATSLELLVTPWIGRADVLQACAQALREGHPLCASSLQVRPHHQNLGGRGFECLRHGHVSDRWWGGLGAEDHAARWLYDTWLEGDAVASPQSPSQDWLALGARVLTLESVGDDDRQKSGQFGTDTLE